MNSKDKLVSIFQKLPGIGPKQAERFAYFIMKQNSVFVNNMSETLKNLKNNSVCCSQCFAWNVSNLNKDVCNICSDPNRDITTLLIVEKELDINAVERTSEFNGLYFVTGGKLPFLVDDPREYIRIRELVSYIQNKLKDNSLKEIIYALPANDEGDNQVNYIRKTISQIVGMNNINQTILARGISTGLEIEYIDHDTFKSAFTFRK